VKSLCFYWRLIATGFAFLLFAVGALCVAIGLSPIRLMPLSLARRRAITRKSIQKCSWIFLRILRALGLLRFQFEGLEHLARPGILVIANHPTLLDAILLMSVMPKTTFVVKAAMAHHPITRWLINMAGYIPNDEGMELLGKAAAALQAGEQLMIFPEGTRTDDEGIRFKRGAANIALVSACPIVPVLIACQPMTLRKCEKWYQLSEKAPHFYVKVLPEIHPAQAVDSQQPVGIQARQLTGLMQSHILDQLQHLA
jgi:1-acyl-sn-glycerol-3-phosphate acyltransferase